jgi:putative transposase
MSKNLKLSSEQIDLIQSVLDSISSKKAVAPSMGRRSMRGRRYSPSEKVAILADHDAGKTANELYERYGICRETLSCWTRRSKMGLEPSATAAVQPTTPPQEKASATSQPAPGAADHVGRHNGYHPHWREVNKIWMARPGIGPAQIRNQLYRKGIKISVATTRKIMEENGYTPPKPTIKEVEINRYEAVRPLELVHMDFKHFYINRSKIYLLLLQDDFSRFLCGHRITDSENMKAVIEAFEECVNRYGKMQVVMTDAGSAFYSWNGINQFQKLMTEEYGVDQIKASTPRSNGKIENVNKQIDKEVLAVDRYASLEEAGNAIREWIRFYNFERTHMGLPPGMVPADRFLPGWNQSGTSKTPAVATAEAKMQADEKAWNDVLSLALGKLKRST